MMSDPQSTAAILQINPSNLIDVIQHQTPAKEFVAHNEKNNSAGQDKRLTSEAGPQHRGVSAREDIRMDGKKPIEIVVNLELACRQTSTQKCPGKLLYHRGLTISCQLEHFSNTVIITYSFKMIHFSADWQPNIIA